MWQAILGLFSGDKIGDTVLDIVRDKAGLNELTEKELLEHQRQRIELITEYQRATKHQSVTRRFIAFCVTAMMVLFVLAWLTAQGFGSLLDWEPGVYYAARIKTFYEDVLLMPTSLVLGFYFGIGAINSIQRPQGTK